MSVSAIIFDLGNVLINIDFDRVFQGWASSLEQSVDEIRRRFEFDDFYRAHERGEINGHDYYQHVLNLLSVKFSFEEFLSGWNEVFVEESPGMAELLRQLKTQTPLYGLTNTNNLHHNEWVVRYSRILKHVRKVYVSSELACRKPEPEIFKAVDLDIGTVKSDQVIFFDDSLVNVEGARRYGWSAFQTTNSRQIQSILKSEFNLL
jgi:glucose-1-phosphatase